MGVRKGERRSVDGNRGEIYMKGRKREKRRGRLWVAKKRRGNGEKEEKEREGREKREGGDKRRWMRKG